MEQAARKKSFGKRLARIVFKTVLFIILFFIVVVLLILTPPVQNILRKKVVSYLEQKLDTRVAIGRIYIGLPKKVIIEDLYLEDRGKDTLLSAGKLDVDIALFDLIFKSAVNINHIDLANSTAKIKRQLPDTAYNFQFIIDAFAPAATDTSTAKSGSSPIKINKINLDKIRLVYQDVVTGNDVETWLDHLDTDIDEIDPDKLRFDIPDINVQGLVARVRQVKPLAVPEPVSKDIVEATEPAPLTLVLKDIDLGNIQFDYANDVSAFYTQVKMGKTHVRVKELDLANFHVNLDALELANTTAAMKLGNKPLADVVATEAKKEVEARAEAGWQISARELKLDQNNIYFDDMGAPAQKRGIDYAHLHASDLTLHANDLFFRLDSMAGVITEGHFAEKSGFQLNELEGRFSYSNTGATLEDLSIITPGSEIKRSAAIHYASLDALKNDIGNMEVEADIDNSKILVRDILSFVPDLQAQPAFADPNAVWYVNSRISGKVSDMKADVLQIRGLSNTSVNISGRLAGLPEMKTISTDLVIHDIRTSRRDIERFMPRGSLPPDIRFPALIAISGKAKGNTEALQANLDLHTDLGAAKIDGDFRQITDPKNAVYDAVVETENLDLGALLQNPSLKGPVNSRFYIKGRGTDPETANISAKGTLASFTYEGYRYRNLNLEATYAQQQLSVNTGIIDPNVHFTATAQADLSTPYPAVVLHATIDSIKTRELHLTPDLFIFRGNIDADFPVTDPKDLQGKLYLTQAILVQNEKRLQLDTVELIAARTDSGHSLLLNSPVAWAKLNGQYDLAQMPGIIQQVIQPYFSVPQATTRPAPYDFTLDAYVVNNPALQTFIPGLEQLDSVTIHGRFSDREGVAATVRVPVADIGPNHIRDLRLNATGNGERLDVRAELFRFNSGTAIELNNTTLVASLANNQADFSLNIQDREKRDKYHITGLLQQPRNGSYAISIRPDSLLLNYDSWTITPGNKILVEGSKVNASNLVLSRNGQELSITSMAETPHAPMEAQFSNFRLATLTGFVQPDSTLADGVMNGKLTLVSMTNNPVFTGDLTVNDLTIMEDTVGNVHLLVNNKVANTFNADVTITGRGNDVRLTGNYYPLSKDNNFDFVLDLRRLPMTTAEAFSNHAIRNASGDVNGRFTVKGTMSRPLVNGDLNFNKAAFNFSMLNSYFRIDQEKIAVNSEGIRFNNFTIRDSSGNRMVINGNAATRDFQHYNFDMRLRANDFHALNSTNKDNKLFWGQVYFNTNLTLKGTEVLPVIDGRLTINPKTKLTVVLPQAEPGVVEREGIVEFADFDAPVNDSLFLQAYDSLNRSAFTGMEVAMTIEVDKDADLTMIVDEGNGDFLNVKGEALLTANIDQSGRIIMAGTYELESGTYELSFNFLRRKFQIEKGSKITWEGEPTTADVNITAKYVANVAPLDLVKSQLSENITTTQRNTYLQKLPFDVLLKMQGELLQPKISFDIVLPDNKSYVVSNDVVTNVRTRLEQVRQEEGEMNKQVFSLLLLNRFVAENPFASSTGGPTASTLARQSASKLLTEQLNRLAGDLVKGVDLNFDVQSSEDYTSGERRDRTDLNVGLSKRLLNDRLTVTVGSNFELEGAQNSTQQSNNIAGDIALDYKVSKDGRYLLRAYRKNQYEGVIDGYIIETGVGFIITLDYNRFREIFQSSERKQRLREQRRLQRQQQEQTDNKTPPDNTPPEQNQPTQQPIKKEE